MGRWWCERRVDGEWMMDFAFYFHVKCVWCLSTYPLLTCPEFHRQQQIHFDHQRITRHDTQRFNSTMKLTFFNLSWLTSHTYTHPSLQRSNQIIIFTLFEIKCEIQRTHRALAAKSALAGFTATAAARHETISLTTKRKFTVEKQSTWMRCEMDE